MTRRMLINAKNPAELRVAIASDGVLEDFKVDVAERGMTRGNIYFGKIANIQPSLNAAFIDYGSERHGFLPIQDVVPDAYYHPVKHGQRARIEDVLEKGQPIVVQVTREPEGQKGAALTTNLSLAGRYLVLMPFETSRAVSRKVTSDEQRRELKRMIESLEIPESCGVIVRTNALGQTKTALSRDLNALQRLWKRIGTEARVSKKTKLLYSDQDIVLQALRDYLDASVEEVVVDEAEAYGRAEEYMRAFMPRSKTRLVHYTDRLPLFAAHQLESQIEGIFDRSVPLPSGGSIVIDRTEALTAIDVNSGRSTKASSQEETAVSTNLEAAREAARQLRLRDIGGLVVVDFIDMRNRRSQAKVEKELRDAMKLDKARVTIGRISANGLLEINRQRLNQAIQLRTHQACPTCSGTGRVRGPEIQTLHLMRTIEARAAGGFMKGVQVSLHPDLANFIQNQRRGRLTDLEQEFDLSIEILATPKLGFGEQQISWFARERAEIQRLEREAAEARKAAEEAARAASIRDAEANHLAGDDDAEEPFDDLDDLDEPDEDAEAGAEAKGHEADGRGASRRGGRRRGRSRRRGRGNGTGATAGDRPREARAPEPEPAAEGAEASRQRESSEPSSGNGRDGDPRRRRRRSRRRRGGSDRAEAASDRPAGEPREAAAPPPVITPPQPPPLPMPPPVSRAEPVSGGSD